MLCMYQKCPHINFIPNMFSIKHKILDDFYFIITYIIFALQKGIKMLDILFLRKLLV